MRIVLLHAERRERRAHHLLRTAVRVPDERFQPLQSPAIGAGREENLHVPAFGWSPVEDRERHGYIPGLIRDQDCVHHLDVDIGLPDLDRAVDVSALPPCLKRDAVIEVSKLPWCDVVPGYTVPLRVVRVHGVLCRVVVVEFKCGFTDRRPVGVRDGKGRIHHARLVRREVRPEPEVFVSQDGPVIAVPGIPVPLVLFSYIQLITIDDDGPRSNVIPCDVIPGDGRVQGVGAPNRLPRIDSERLARTPGEIDIRHLPQSLTRGLVCRGQFCGDVDVV